MHVQSGLERILELIADRRGIDLRRYRPAMVERRVLGRLRLAGAGGYEEYLGRLNGDDAELDRLIAYACIKVSQFYRDPAAFDLLRCRVLPDLAAGAQPRPLRLWSAGCGWGEEAYTLAMLLAEAEAETAGVRPGGQVMATDIDTLALAAAQRGRYPNIASVELPEELAASWLLREEGAASATVTVAPALRARVRFAAHNLLSGTPPPDAPFDLVCCRNVLIYFERGEQQRVQQLLWESIRPGGYLCLGKAETLATALLPGFDVIDRPTRIYRRKPFATQERST